MPHVCSVQRGQKGASGFLQLELQVEIHSTPVVGTGFRSSALAANTLNHLNFSSVPQIKIFKQLPMLLICREMASVSMLAELDHIGQKKTEPLACKGPMWPVSIQIVCLSSCVLFSITPLSVCCGFRVLKWIRINADISSENLLSLGSPWLSKFPRSSGKVSWI